MHQKILVEYLTRLSDNFLRACSSGHFEEVKRLINECNVNPQYVDHNGNTCLVWACCSGNVNLVRWLIKCCKCNPIARNHHDQALLQQSIISDTDQFELSYYHLIRSYSTSLHFASTRGHLNIVEFLVSKANCDPNCYNDGGDTPLTLACYTGHLHIVKYLIGRTDCIDQSENGHSPLQRACGQGHLHIAQYLITECKCNPLQVSKKGITLLHLACLGGHLRIVKLLAEKHHCDPDHRNKHGLTPLHLACQIGHLKLCTYLITKLNCNPKCISDGGTTPLHSACRSGNVDLVKYLIDDNQCDPLCRDQSNRTPLHIAIMLGKLKVVQYLLSHHLSPQYSDTEGNQPLHLACVYGRLDLVEWFLNNDEYNIPMARNNIGKTPLHLSSQGGHIAIVKCLVEHPRSSESEVHYCHVADNEGNVPLHLACKNGHITIVKYFTIELKQNCNLTCTNSLKQTPLHLACLGGHFDVVEHLVTQCNCSPNCFDIKGITPLHVASKMGNFKILECLCKHPHCNCNCQSKSGYTPLHLACEEGHSNIVVYLTDEKGCDPECETYAGNTPFMFACASNHESVARFLLPRCDPLHLNKKGKGAIVTSPAIRKAISDFYEYKKKYPIESYVKVFVIGDPGAGKSTLVQALQQNQGLIKLLLNPWQKIPESKVSKQTTGIDTFTCNNKSFGNVVIYDFAGQYEYYTTNAAFLQSFTSQMGAIFLLVINASHEISASLHYWLSFITDNWAHNKTKAHVIIIGSHEDKVQGNIEDVYTTIEKVAYLHDADDEQADKVCLDCRYPSSALEHLCTCIARKCTILRRETIDGRCYVLYDHIISKYPKQTCTLQDLTRSLHVIDHPFLSPDPNDLLKLLRLLHDKGQVILLEDCNNLVNSWVIDNVQLLLKTVVGTVFAPTDFKEHLQVSNGVGIVSKSRIVEQFQAINSSLIIGFLEHFHFCHRVDPTSLGLDKDETYFFPALVTKNRPTVVWDEEYFPHVTYHCGWCMQCCRQSDGQPKFLPARWLHIVLLRLAYTFALPTEDHPHSITEKSDELPGWNRSCKIWKNGLFWRNDEGICTLFEVIEHMHTAILIMSCPSDSEISCVRLRSKLLQTILCAFDEFCPQNIKHLREYIIDPVNPSQLYNKPQIASNLRSHSVQSLVQNIYERKKFMKSPDPMLVSWKLLYFEPYIVFSRQAVEELLSEENSKKVVSTEFIAQLALCASVYKASKALQEIIRPFPHEMTSESSFTVCKQTLESWKERKGSKRATYEKLHHKFDKYSIFQGRNPYEIATTRQVAHPKVPLTAVPRGDRPPSTFQWILNKVQTSAHESAKRMYHWRPLFALALIAIVLHNIISLYGSSDMCTSKLARNNLPVLNGTVIGRGSEVVKLYQKLESEETRIMNIYGRSACGKSTLAISLGYKMASCKVAVRYLDLSETELLSASCNVTKGYNICPDELVEWAANLNTDTLLILDNYNLLESSSLLYDMLFQLYKAAEINLKIIVTTRQTLIKSRITSISSFRLLELDSDSAISLLQNLTTVRLTKEECRELARLADNDPLTIKFISSLLSNGVCGDITFFISDWKMKKSIASLPKEVPIQLSHNRMNATGQGCARYLSMFRGSFDEEAAKHILSSSGFSDPSYCVQILAKYSLIEQYTHYQQQRFKLPRVIRDFYANVRRERQHNEYETATFQKGFKKYYTQLFGPLTNKSDESNLLRVESHNIRHLRNIP